LTEKIFLLQEGNKLVEMEEMEYVSEDVLQDLIAKYPNLLAGDEMDENIPRRWLLVQREQVLPYDSTGLKLFYLDHLFLDQDGVPTIVETKRSSDNRLRREVVAQMLDYASNAMIYLPVEEIRLNLVSNYPDRDQGDLLKEKLGLDMSPDELFERVKTNLQAGKIRLVFVADEIPTELKTIVEFLNLQMDPAEVLCVEVKQYIGEGLKTLVPRLVGQTAEAKIKKISSNKLDEKSFFEHLGEEESVFYRKLLDFAKEEELMVIWTAKSFSLNVQIEGDNVSILRGYCNLSAFGQTLFTTVGNISSKVPNGESIVEEYKNGLETIGKKAAEGYSFNIREMDDKQLKTFYEVLARIIEKIKYN
jgi:hypothetical protein